jgi:YndJ-like protein
MKNVSNSPLNWFFEPMHPLSFEGLGWAKISLILLISVLISSQPTHPSWAVSMILIAAFILVPIGFQQLMKRSADFNRHFNTNSIYLIHLTSAILLAISFALKQGIIAGLLALPYALWCAFITIKILKLDFKIPYITTLAAWGFLTNASIWCIFDRLNFQPWNFSPWIVLLTGAHFHYAGFALTLTLALFLNENPSDILFKNCSRAILAGVVLTAIGITTTQLGLPIIIETFASVWMALAAFSVGCAVILRACPPRVLGVGGYVEKSTVKRLWILGGICLTLGMTLAIFYALRHFIIIDWLSIPNMQAIHGTLNALGFGTLMILGWSFKK